MSSSVLPMYRAEGHCKSAYRIHAVVFSTHEHATLMPVPSMASSCTMSRFRLISCASNKSLSSLFACVGMKSPTTKRNTVRPDVTVSYRSIVARTCSRRPTAKGAVTIPSAWKGSTAADEEDIEE